MIRAVIDTNVLVSGLLSPTGNEALVLLAVHQGIVRPCWSEDIFAEYADVLYRPKFPFLVVDIETLFEKLRKNGEGFQPQGSISLLPHIEDTKFLHCAEAAQSEMIITGNKRHFPAEICGSIKVVSAAEIVKTITAELLTGGAA